MIAFVVDVNVAIVANGTSEQADTVCELACVQKMRQVKDNLIVIDDKDRILSEYRRYLSMRGQPGVGDEFMYWVHQNQYTPSKCERVTLTEDPNRVFEEFPDDPDLAGFHKDDRMYVAVAVGSKHSPRILNAVDSDWRNYEDALRKNGLDVEQLCPQCLKGS